MNDMEDQHIIREWGASRYREDKKWTKGTLKLGANFICFKETEREKGLILSLETITGLRMEKSWLVFNTLVLLVGPKMYWFSSFTCTSPYTVLHTIEHFWKEGLLLATIDSSGISGSKVRTKLGKESLSEAYQAQMTLASAASDLNNQREQLEGAADGIDKINKDLGIAENNLSHLESWLGRWRMRLVKTPSNSNTDNFLSKDKNLEYSIMYAIKPQDAQKPGFFAMQNKEIKILDSKHTVILSFEPQEVTRIAIATPWELVITRRLIGQCDVYAFITSAKLIYVLKELQPVYGEKIDYDDPEVHGRITKTGASQQTPTAQQKLLGLILTAAEMSKSNSRRTTFTQDQPIGPQMRTLQEAQGVTDDEAEELSRVLQGLKSLATEIGPELERQDQLIEQLTQEVTNASDRINRNNKRMNRLL